MLPASDKPGVIQKFGGQPKHDLAREHGSPTIRVLLRRAPSTPQRRQTEPAQQRSNRNPHKVEAAAEKGAAEASAEAVDLITALSNPLLYPRPPLLPALQRIIQSLEVAHLAVEAYAAGEYMTDNPIKVALERVAAAWTTLIAPLNAIHGLPGLSKSDREERSRARKAVGQKLLGLAREKQMCIQALKKLQKGHEDGPATKRLAADKQFDAALVELIRFSTMMATIEHALQVATDKVAVKMIADGPALCELRK